MRGTLFTMTRTFASALREALEAKGWTAYRLEVAGVVARSATSRYLSGQDVPRDTTIDEIADKLGANAEELHALADVHRLGPARIAGILKHGQAALGAQPATEAPAPAYAGPPQLRVVGKVRKPHALDALTGGAPLLGKWERAAVQELQRIAPGGDLAAIGCGPDAAVWCYEGRDRLKGLNQRIKALGGQVVVEEGKA